MIRKEIDEQYKQRAKDLVAQMTLEEKFTQMTYRSQAIPRLGIFIIVVFYIIKSIAFVMIIFFQNIIINFEVYFSYSFITFTSFMIIY